MLQLVHVTKSLGMAHSSRSGFPGFLFATQSEVILASSSFYATAPCKILIFLDGVLYLMYKSLFDFARSALN